MPTRLDYASATKRCGQLTARGLKPRSTTAESTGRGGSNPVRSTSQSGFHAALQTRLFSLPQGSAPNIRITPEQPAGDPRWGAQDGDGAVRRHQGADYSPRVLFPLKDDDQVSGGGESHPSALANRTLTSRLIRLPTGCALHGRQSAQRRSPESAQRSDAIDAKPGELLRRADGSRDS